MPINIQPVTYYSAFKKQQKEKIAQLEAKFSEDVIDVALNSFSNVDAILNRYLVRSEVAEFANAPNFVRNAILQSENPVLKHDEDRFLYNEVRIFALGKENQNQNQIMNLLDEKEEDKRIDNKGYSIRRPSAEEMPGFLKDLSDFAGDYLEFCLKKFPKEAAKVAKVILQEEKSAAAADRKRKNPEDDLVVESAARRRKVDDDVIANKDNNPESAVRVRDASPLKSPELEVSKDR